MPDWWLYVYIYACMYVCNACIDVCMYVNLSTATASKLQWISYYQPLFCFSSRNDTVRYLILCFETLHKRRQFAVTTQSLLIVFWGLRLGIIYLVCVDLFFSFDDSENSCYHPLLDSSSLVIHLLLEDFSKTFVTTPCLTAAPL